MGKMNGTDTWHDDCDKFNCPIYTNLFNNILIEKKAPLKRSFQLFCVKAHYKQITDKNTICDKIQNEIKQLLEKQNAGYSFDSIEDICCGYAEIIQQHCFAQEATMYQKIQLRKFFYIKDFTNDGYAIPHWHTSETIIENGWNENYAFFFKQIQSVFLNNNNIFNKIASFNKCEFFTFNDVKKIKLNNELLDQIFCEFKFRSLTRSSSVPQILKSIYNTFFGKTIIKTEYKKEEVKKKNHILYSVDENMQLFYDFCENHLLLDSVTKNVKKGEVIDCDTDNDMELDFVEF
jgi:hypothetical protein